MSYFYLLLSFAFLSCTGVTDAEQTLKSPNIVFILTDDQDMRMDSLHHMQKVKQLLMAEGTTYKRHYAPTALCCPARVSLLTGLYAYNHKVTDVNGLNGGWKQVLESGLNDNYLPIWLKRARYRAYYTGKLYNGMKKELVENSTARGCTESLLSVDDLVEGFVKILKEKNQLDNTFIIYSSDNGFHLGHHRLGIGKKYAFEEDINVPLIIRGPGVPKDQETDIVTKHVDFAPTILKTAGASNHNDFDGKPIPYTAQEILEAERSINDEYANVEFWTGATYKLQGLKGKRINSYKSVRLAGKDYDISYTVQCDNNAHELYNMKEDPVQMRNLHPSAPTVNGTQNAFYSGENKRAGFDITRLAGRVDALLLVLKSCKGNECRDPWKQLHPSGEVNNLKDAMNERFDNTYKKLTKIRFNKCFTDGTIDLGAEGPQWNGGLLNRDGLEFFEFHEGTTASVDEQGSETSMTSGWEGEEGY